LVLRTLRRLAYTGVKVGEVAEAFRRAVQSRPGARRRL